MKMELHLCVLNNLLLNAHALESAKLRLLKAASVALTGRLEFFPFLTPEDLKSVAIRHRDFKSVIIVGGDGSIAQVVEAFSDVGFQGPFGIVPCGRANDLARALGISFNWERALQIIGSRKSRKIDKGIFCNNGNSSNQIFLTQIGFGLPHKVVKTAQRLPRFLNSFGYLFGLLCSYSSAGLHFAELQIDGKAVDFLSHKQLLMVLGINTEVVSGLLPIFKAVSASSGEARLLAYRANNMISFVGDVGLALRGLLRNSPNAFFAAGKKVTFRLLTPAGVELDGDTLQEPVTEASIEILPSALSFFAER